MKPNKKLIICTMIVLMLFLCVNASSAEEQLYQTLDNSNDGLSMNECKLVVDETSDGEDINVDKSISIANESQGKVSESCGDVLSKNGGDSTLTDEPNDVIYVSLSGNNQNDGQTRQTAVKTITKAIELANAGSGNIIITEGTYTESNIEIDVDKPISIAGEGNVVIDGDSASNSVFVMHGGEANFKNIKFTNAKPDYGGAIFMNYGTGTSRDVIEVNVIVENCTFDNLKTSKRGGAIYAWYVRGNIVIRESNFHNMEVSQWGGAVCVGYSPNVDIEILNSKFENNSANNGGGAYLQAKTVRIADSKFNNNSAEYDSGAIYLSNSTSIIDCCVITNNKGGSQGVAIKFTRPTNGNPPIRTLTITNSIIENNSATTGTLSAIYVDMETLDISYSSLINDFSIETRTGQGYDAVYGQGIAIANNNWWGTNNPTTKVTGKNITVDKWVIMNVEASSYEVDAGDEVTITVDFKHVNTTGGEIEELAGGEIPKESYDVKFTVENGTIEPETLKISKGEVKHAIFTAGNANALVNVKSGEASVDIIYKIESEESDYHGIIYVDMEGMDSNNGSEIAPVASIGKAIELANKGSGQIVINEGTYTGNTYHVTKALNITGNGNVILDANNEKLFTMGYGDTADWLILTNLTIIDANQAIYSFADELILINLKLANNPGSSSLIKNYGDLTMDNCIISNNNGGNVIDGGNIVINNTVIENNIVSDYAIVYTTSNTHAIIENTTFRNNTGQLGIVKISNKVTIKNSKFINNTNIVAYGGAINDFDELTVTNSTFINNKANRDSGAINVATNRKATIIKSVFINNSAGTGYHGDAICNFGKLTINYCVLLTNDENGLIYSESEDEVNAEYNWWGTNNNPKSLNGVGTYEDDWGEEVPCEIDSSKWVVMNVTSNLSKDTIDVGDNVEITVDFTNYMDLTNSLKPLSDDIPEVVVTSSALNGALNCSEDRTDDNLVKFLYAAIKPGEDTITISSSKASIEIPITVEGSFESIIYVDGTAGVNTNDGKTRETAVQTIEKAVEIAEGKIIILPGEYTVNSVLNITKDLEIIGEGEVIVKSNVAQTVTYEEYDDWDEVWVTKTKTVYILIENNANLNISNIKFTLVPASINMEMITNNANLFIDSCEFNNIKVTGSKGVIQNAKEATLEVNGTIFKSSSSTYGAINNNGELLVNNSKFVDVDRTGEAAVYSTAITSYNKATILNTEFKNNKGGAGGAIYIMYSYVNLANPVVDIINCTFEENKATGTYGDGAAVKCSGNQVTLTIINSTFNKNIATRNGGAIYAQGTVNIDRCVFTENAAATANTVYAYGGIVDISNSIILGTGNAISIYESSYATPATVTANDNWWGTNDKPASAGENITVVRWVKMDASFTPATAQAGDEVTVTATFDNDKLPDGVINVTFTSTTGNLNDVVDVINARASTTYATALSDEAITATSSGVSIVLPIEPPAPIGTIYVSYENGDDSRDGLSADSSVKNIAHAIELADAGIGKIILLQGTHVIDEVLVISKDLDIRGIGTVVIDGNHTRFIQNCAGLNLTNIEFTNGHSTDSSLISTESTGQYINLNNVKFYRNSGKNGIAVQSNIKLVINNSEFYDNDLFEASQNSQGLIHSNSAITTVENTVFRNNVANKGAGLYFIKGSADIINCTFDGNIAQAGNGAGIYVSGDGLVVDIISSTFTNNLANMSENNDGGYGSAIYVGSGVSATITKSVFINNIGNGENLNDAGIYVSSGTLDISDSIILTNGGDSKYAINVGDGNVIAENNWWGSNDKANTNAEVNKIVKMTAILTPEGAQVGDNVTITLNFDNDNLPKGIIKVEFVSSSGALNELITMNDSQTSLNYTVDEKETFISIKSSQTEILFPFNPEKGVIFVSPNGDDANPGTRDAPVETIARALEITTKGKIVLLEGTHKTDDLGIISYDLNITGEGRVIIDAQNSNRILYVGEDAKVMISNVVMINGYTADESGALIGNSNELTLINCTLANSSAAENNGGAIFSVGKLTIINTTVANCSAVRGGAIYTQTENENVFVRVFNSTFESNVAKGKETWGGGAIYAQRTGGISDFALTLDNTTFKNNEAQGTSCGGAIQIEQLVSTVKITGCEFISNHANGKEGYGGGAVYTSSPTSYDRQGTMEITGSLFENNTCDANGGAIFAKTTTLNIANSVFIDNSDDNGLEVYGSRSEVTSPSITLNDNWWGTNDSPKDLVGGNGYNPTLNRWAILTIINDTPIIAGNTVKLTVSINNYTTGVQNGTLSKPITIKCNVVIKTTFGEITGTLRNGELTYDYTVPENLKYIAATVDNETQVLYAISSPVNVEINEITARKYDKVSVEINVTSSGPVNEGVVELYVNGEKLIATIEVKDSKAVGDIVISENEGKYNLTAKYINGLPLFEDSEKNSTLTVSGAFGLYNETFFNFFDDEGYLRDEITDDELVFHGEFSQFDIHVITITRPISIKGDDAKLYGMSLCIKSDDVKVNDMTLIADGADFTASEGAAILAAGENIELNNISVNYTAPSDKSAYGILVKSANGFKLSNSTIVFDANNNAKLIQQAGIIIDNSNDVEINANKINARLPARDVAFNYYYPDLSGIYQDLVLGIGMQNCENINFTNNEIIVDSKSSESKFATIDSFMVDSVKSLLIRANNFTQTEFSSVGKAGYANVLDLYNFEDIIIENNNILVNTTTGESGAGTAYPIQANGPYTGLIIKENNLTSISKGPALGIYSQNYDGITDICVTKNVINVTGYATADEYALVSGMELQDTIANVYDNVIYSKSISSYDDVNALYGISYAQYTSGTHTYDIRRNTVYSEGKYAIYILNSKNSNVTGNTLYAHELVSDSAVKIVEGENNNVGDNLPFNISKLTIEVANITVGHDAMINITIDKSIDGVATVIVDGEIYVVDVLDGFGNVTVSDLAAGDYKVTAIFKSDNGYDDCKNSRIFNVAKLASDINIIISDAELGEDATITVSIPGATGSITVVVNGKDEEIALENGNATYIIEDIAAGDYHISVFYSGDKNHGFANDTKSFSVYKFESEVNMSAVPEVKVGEETTITVNVTEGATGSVIIDVDGTEYVIDLNETNNITVSFDETGEYSIIAKYGGDGKYNASESDVTTILVSDKQAANIQVEIVSKENLTVGDEIEMLIKADTDAELIVMVNGIEISPVDGALSASLSNALENTYKYTADKEGFYNVTVFAKETDEFASELYSEVFYVAKKDAKLNITMPESIKPGESPNVDVSIPGATGNVTVLVDGKKVAEASLVNGSASVHLDALAAGDHVVEIRYSGDDKFDPITEAKDVNLAKLTASVSADPVETTECETATIAVKVTEGATGTVIVEVAGNKYAGDIKDGVATVNVAGLAAGNYTATITYDGDGKFNGSSATVAVKVVAKETPVEPVIPGANITVPDVKAGESSAVNVTLPGDATGNVTVLVDGKEVANTSVTNGSASVAVPEMAGGDHVVEVVYSGDGKYAPVSKKSNVSVAKIDVPENTISTNISIAVGTKSPIFNITVADDATGYITITVSGVDYYSPIENGAVSIRVPSLPYGTYDVNITYSGDDKYNSFVKNTTVTVPKPELIANNVTMLYMGNYKFKVLLKVNGKAVAGQNVTIKFKGNTYKVLTDSKGYATLKLPTVKPKATKYTISVLYKDVKISNKVKVNSVIVVKNFKAKKSAASLKIKVTLKKVNKKYLRNKAVSVKFNGKTYKAKTNSKGVATFTINKKILNKLAVGKKYTYRVTFGKDVVKKKITIVK